MPQVRYPPKEKMKMILLTMKMMLLTMKMMLGEWSEFSCLKNDEQEGGRERARIMCARPVGNE